MAYSKPVKKQFVELRAQGLSFDKISAEMGICKLTLKDWSIKLEKHINFLELVKAQELMGQYNLTRRDILAAKLAELDRVRKTIGARDLSKESIKTLRVMEKELNGEVRSQMYDFREAAGLLRTSTVYQPDYYLD